MAKLIDGLAVRIGLTVDEHTANTCLRLIELYVNQNNIILMGRKDENGEFHYWFEDTKKNCN